LFWSLDILLTAPLGAPSGLPTSQYDNFSYTPSHHNPLTSPYQPLVKLTDFGLSRFIDPLSPLLTTRCGSEAYAAPELVMGGGRRGVASSPLLWGLDDRERCERLSMGGGYDARETDAWACGVVLFSLVGRKLPFGEGPGESIMVGETANPPNSVSAPRHARTPSATASERRAWLMKIARAEWEWPGHSSIDTVKPPRVASEGEELKGVDLVESEGAQRIARKLLVRDPSKRARIGMLWEDDWMNFLGSGAPTSVPPVPPVPSAYTQSPTRITTQESSIPVSRSSSIDDSMSGTGIGTSAGSTGAVEDIPVSDGSSMVVSDDELEDHLGDDDVDEEEMAELEKLEDVSEDGWLVDREAIPPIVREEVH
jgi:protein-serine/threonine kinase